MNLQRTSRTISNLSFDVVSEAVRNPRMLPVYAKRVRASIRKDRMDMDAERAERPQRLAEVLGADIETLESYESEISGESEFLSKYDEGITELKDAGVYGGTTPRFDCETLYILTRTLQPESAVVTGARYGGFDAFIVAAMEQNQKGHLTSIDLPDGPEKFEYGYLIPESMRGRWSIELGDARDILPNVLSDIGPVDLFVHDSLHEWDHMTWEYEMAHGELADNGVIASHDVLLNDAFQEFANGKSMSHDSAGNVGFARC